MPRFGELFYKKFNNELSIKNKEKLQVRLNSIYKAPITNYQNRGDFQICRDQLVTLLESIIALNPPKFDLFEQYRLNVLKLPADSLAEDDIRITLSAAKQEIEQSLLKIEKNHGKVDAEVLNSFIVSECYAGAYSNMSAALTLFTATSLDLLVASAKTNLLKAIALDFTNERHITSCIGNETHNVNGLFNHAAPFYGLEPDKEHLATIYSAPILDIFVTAAKEEMNIGSFMDSLKLLVSPPNVPLSSTQKGDFKLLDDFYGSLGEEASKDQYQHIYNEVESEDGYDLTLVPKTEKEFNIFYTCLLASYLEKASYLKGLRFEVDGTKLFYNGQDLVEITNDGSYKCLEDDKIIDLFVQLNEDKIELALLLLCQISTERLIILYQNNHNLDFFKILLKKHDLPTMIETLYARIIQDPGNPFFQLKVSSLAEYAYKNNCNLPEQILQTLGSYLSSERQLHYFDKAIRCNSALQVTSLLKSNAQLAQKIWESNYLPYHVAVRFKAVAALVSLANLHWPVNEVDAEGNSAVMFTINPERAHLLYLLGLMHANLDLKNKQGHSPASVAAQNGLTEILKVLHFFHAKLDEHDTNKAGLTPLCHAAVKGKVETVELLLRFGVNPNKATLHNNNTAVWLAAAANHPEVIAKLHEYKALLNIKNEKGVSPCWIAASRGHINALTTLKELGADVQSPDTTNSTPAYIAARMGHIDIIQLLLDCRSTYFSPFEAKKEELLNAPQADPKTKNRIQEIIDMRSNGNKVLLYPKDIAYIMGHDEIVTMIEESRHPEKLSRSPSYFMKRFRSYEVDQPNKRKSMVDFFALHKSHSENHDNLENFNNINFQ